MLDGRAERFHNDTVSFVAGMERALEEMVGYAEELVVRTEAARREDRGANLSHAEFLKLVRKISKKVEEKERWLKSILTRAVGGGGGGTRRKLAQSSSMITATHSSRTMYPSPKRAAFPKDGTSIFLPL